MKKRILFIVHLPPPVHGTTKVCETIKNSRLLAAQFDCSFINCSGSKSMNDVNRVSVRKAFRLAAVFFETARQLVFKRYDLVYLTIAPCGPAFIKDSILIFMAKAVRQKVVIHLHGRGIALERQRSRTLNWYYKKVFSGVHVIHLSKKLMDDVQEIVAPDKQFVVANGVECAFVPDFKEKAAHAVPTVLYLSNLIESKGYFDLLEAAVDLKKRSVQCRITFVGAHHVSDAANKVDVFIKEHGLKDMVHFVGPKYAEEKDGYLKTADVFVLPTVHDCFPLCILEAMAAGLPVISTDIGAISEMVEDGVTGLIVPIKKPEALADAIERLVKNSELCRRLGQAGFETYAKEYTVEAFENKLCAILTQITQRVKTKASVKPSGDVYVQK